MDFHPKYNNRIHLLHIIKMRIMFKSRKYRAGSGHCADCEIYFSSKPKNIQKASKFLSSEQLVNKLLITC